MIWLLRSSSEIASGLSGHHTWGSWGGLYEGGHDTAYSSVARGEASSKAMLSW
jgi:hypothetical protein